MFCFITKKIDKLEFIKNSDRLIESRLTAVGREQRDRAKTHGYGKRCGDCHSKVVGAGVREMERV